MKLPVPLSNLVYRCQTICVPECCGLDAYDFSPVHIASYLLMWRGAPDDKELAQIRMQLNSLQRSYGTNGTVAHGVAIDEMNQTFTAGEVDSLVEEIAYNLESAIRLVEEGEARRYMRSSEQK